MRFNDNSFIPNPQIKDCIKISAIVMVRYHLIKNSRVNPLTH